jgi:hypothetical protein
LSATASVGSVTVDSFTNVNLVGVSATGEVGRILIWEDIIPIQDPNWQVISTAQTPNWTEVRT